jgi:hypothetical protein
MLKKKQFLQFLGNVFIPVLPFYLIVALPNDGRNYRLKRVVLNVMNI